MIRYKRPRPKHVAGEMNKLESAYALHLEWLKRAGEIEDYRFERLKFKLAGNTFYTPDFLVVKKEFLEIHEVKGFMMEDANVKLKVAADSFPWFKFVLVTREKNIWQFKTYE